MTQFTNWLISLVASGGLIAIFIMMAGESAGLPISSEIVVPLGGALAAQGKLGGNVVLAFILVVLASSAGNLAGSLVAYLLTKRYGEQAILSRAGRWMGLSRGHLRLANRFFGKYGMWAVFLGRLLPIVRTYISFPAGLSRVRLVTFIVATTAGAIPWNFALTYAGYKLGQNYEVVAKYLGPVGIPLAILVVILLVAAWWYGRKMGEEEEERFSAEPSTRT